MQNSTRERLIPIVLDSLMKHIDKSCNLAENIVDDLIASGVFLPPCDVGGTVYCIYRNEVVQGTVRLIRPFISKEEVIFKGNIICEVYNIFFDDGRKEEVELYVVFEKPYGSERVAYLTKEQAEQKLNETRVDNA